MLNIALIQVILESKLAQYASRFQAMSEAHNRAKESVSELKMVYSRSIRNQKDERLKEIINGIKKATMYEPRRIITIKDLIIRVEFASQPPEIGEVLIVKNKQQSPLLVDSYLNDTTAVCINLRSSKQLEKGMEVERTGKGIEIPVGKVTIGRVFDPLGEPLDGNDPVPLDNPRKNIIKLSGGSTILYQPSRKYWRPASRSLIFSRLS